MRVSDIAAAVDSHANTVRAHLDELIERSLVVTSTARPQGRGRPAVLYEARPGPGARTAEYRALAAAFTADLADTGNEVAVRARSRKIGRAWGAELARPPAAGDSTLPDLMADLGFGPRADDDTLFLTTCPLLDLAVENPDVICQVHLGLIEQLLESTGEPSDVHLVPFAGPGYCRLQTSPRS